MIAVLTRALTRGLAFTKNSGFYRTMNLIDLTLTREQFDGFDAHIVNALCAATQSDLREWSNRLLDSCAAGDTDAASRARHALKGLCGNYGAQQIVEMFALPLAEPGHQAAFRACVEATISAILAVAETPGEA